MARSPRRILVALDARPESLHALERTAALAAALGAEIAGVFVEDDSLMRLCELPVMEISLRGGTARRPNADVLRRELRARASEARRALERVALARQLGWTFRVARGRVDEEVLRAAPEGDVVAPSRALRRAAARRRPVVAAVLGEDDDDRPLVLAALLARTGSCALLVLVPERALTEPDALRARIEGALGPETPAAVAGYDEGGEGLAGRLEGLDLEVLVLRAHSLTPSALGRLRAAAGCDVVSLGDTSG